MFDRNKMLFVLILSLCISLIQVSSVNNLLPSIEHAIGASQSDIQWVLSGYSLAFGLLLVPMGRLGDIFGRSMMWMIGVAIFTVASILCGIAADPVMLNLARALQGVGAGVFSPQVTGMIQQYFEGHERARAFSYMGLAISASVAVGPVLSGFFVLILQDAGWRWSFVANAPIGIAAFLLGLRWLAFSKERRTIGPNAAKNDATYRRSAKRAGKEVGRMRGLSIDLDPVGTLLLAVAVLAIMLPFMLDASWRWWLLLLGIFAAASWVWWEGHYERDGHIPMVSLSMFRTESYALGTLISAVQFLGTTSVFVVLAMAVQQGLGFGAFEAGFIGLPNAIVSGYMAVWAGRYAVNKGREVQVGAFVAILVSLVATIPVAYWVFTTGASGWWLAIPITIEGIGLGAVGSANQTPSMMEIPSAHGGTAGGVQQTSQRIATAIGTALITAVLFACVPGGPEATAYQWAIGFGWAMGTIALIVALALALSVVYMRRGRVRRAV